MMPVMRSTVRIEDDLLEALKRRAEAEGVSLTRALNTVLRSGLKAVGGAEEPRPRFVQRTVSMGPALVNLHKAREVAALLEDDALVSKLAERR